jgi:rubrerythrin
LRFSGLAYPAGSLQASTKKDLMNAMRGVATLKYMAYADAARTHGNTQLAGLFERTAAVEHREHFAELARLVGTNSDKLKGRHQGRSL